MMSGQIWAILGTLESHDGVVFCVKNWQDGAPWILRYRSETKNGDSITKPSISSQPLDEIGRMWGLNEATDETNRAPKDLSDWCEIDRDRTVTTWSDMWDLKENGQKCRIRMILHREWCWECLTDVEQWKKRVGDALKSMQLAEKLRKGDQKTRQHNQQHSPSRWAPLWYTWRDLTPQRCVCEIVGWCGGSSQR